MTMKKIGNGFYLLKDVSSIRVLEPVGFQGNGDYTGWRVVVTIGWLLEVIPFDSEEYAMEWAEQLAGEVGTAIEMDTSIHSPVQ